MKFFMEDFFSKCDQICRKPADLVTFTEENLMEKFIFCAVKALQRLSPLTIVSKLSILLTKKLATSLISILCCVLPKIL